MKFTTVFAVLATLATAVSATISDAHLLDTNAKRFKMGLRSPMPPARRALGSPTYAAKRGYPSGTPGTGNSCNSGPVQCCDTVTHANSDVRGKIESLIGVVVGSAVPVGLNCSPLSVLGLGGTSCSSQTVCCENNNFNGLVAIGCSPINL